MRVTAAAALLALVLAAPAAGDDVPTTPVATLATTTTTATTTATTTTVPAPTTTAPPVTTTAPAATTAPVTTSAPEPRPRILVPAEVAGSWDPPEIVPVPAHVEGVLRTLGLPLGVTPPLAAGPYVFPVAGDVSWGDSYGGPRSDVPGGWHHGDDLFAKLGQPVLAVADGHVYKVGWQRLGGWRLWLKDREGNRFYYAHLAGYAPLAKDHAEVKAGDVVGYIGHTGDAYTTPTHLHFEIHPVSLLWLHYNGAVDPTGYLNGWKRLSAKERPRPAPLPLGAAKHGEGALSDYRRLLSLFPRPVVKTTEAAPAAAPARGTQILAAASTRRPDSGRPFSDYLAIGTLVLVGALLAARQTFRRTSG
jgi:murein DD-endopeptidase MepM/ murein hydrolase activator NlpD